MEIKAKMAQALKSPFDRLLLGLFILLILMVIGQYGSKQSSQKSEEPFATDTYIPEGFVLVPIKLENHESVDSVVTQFAVVNIYRGAPEGGKTRLIGRSLKLLRAPLNPQQFAVLVPEAQADPFMDQHQKLHAVLQNRGLSLESEMPKPVIGKKIIYY